MKAEPNQSSQRNASAGSVSNLESPARRGCYEEKGDVKGRFGVVLLTNSNEGDWLRWPVIYDFTMRGGIAML
jgi:hypothetical protein